MLLDLPFLTVDVPPVPARARQRPEDFVVEELPAYPASGAGEHVHMLVEKVGLTTHDAVRAVARALERPPREVGFAGMKDARAVTRQMLSLSGVDLERARGLELPGLRVLSAERHGNKLRLGHLRGNRFALKLRGADPAGDGDVRAALAVLGRRGVPNYFGEQRFGARGDSWEIGRALLRGDPAEAVALFAGRPGPADTGRVLRARELFESGRFGDAARAWPGGFRDAIRLCRAMERSGGDPRRSLHAVDRQLLRLFVSAFQSHLFNALLARRLQGIDHLLQGDLAWKHVNGAVFLVTDLAAEAPRAEAFEVSPSGPLFGERMTAPEGRPAELEAEVLAAEGVEPRLFARRGGLQWKGARRPLRFPLRELELTRGEDDAGAFLELRFVLPPGCYATAVLRELTKEAREPGA